MYYFDSQETVRRRIRGAGLNKLGDAQSHHRDR
jgi:hypothetical protein